jgi:hypothetical protein
MGLAAAIAALAPGFAQAEGAGQRSTALAKPAWCLQQAVDGASASDPRFAPLASKFAARQQLRIVAIGSSSTAGSDLPDPALAYPTHLERHLNAQFGAGRISVVNKGKGGEAIEDTVRRFDEDLLALKPDLVIWQLGANDIVRGADMARAEASVDDGLSRLAVAGVPVVMMDSQAAPKIMQSARRGPIDSMLRRAAHEYGAPFWSRYELMQTIMSSGRAASAELTRADDLHMTVAMHVCTAAALGDALAGYLTRTTITAAR